MSITLCSLCLESLLLGLVKLLVLLTDKADDSCISIYQDNKQ